MIEIPDWEYVETVADAHDVLEEVQNLPEVAIDTETTGLVRWRDRVIYWSMSDGKKRWCLPASALGVFEKYLQDPARTLIFHNANYDSWMLANSGIDILKHTPRSTFRRADTLVAHSLFAADDPHDLKWAGPDVICTRRGHAPFDMPSFKEVFGGVPRGKTPGEVLVEAPFDKMADYASLDAWVTYHLYQNLRERLQRRSVSDRFAPLMGLDPSRSYSLWDYFQMLEMPMLDVCYSMERQGSLIDTEYLAKLGEPMLKRMGEWEVKLARIAGKVLNLRSPMQLRWLFFDKDGPLKLPWKKKTPKGDNPSTDVEVLKQLVEDGVEAAEIVLAHRNLAKLVGTYINGILDGEKGRLNWRTNRIHTTFNQHVARTGRLSSSDPNVQNIPARSKEGALIRKAFIAPPSHVLMVADYGQLEPRITAGFSNDRNMCTAIQGGLDQHSWTTSLLFDVSYKTVFEAKNTRPEERTPEQKRLVELRNRAKVMGLGMTYGEGPTKLAKQMKIEFMEAKALTRKYHAAYPGVQEYFDENIKFAEKTEYITTLLGRRRDLASINGHNRMIYQEACRQAQNSPIQGTAAEIVKKAQINIYLDDDLWEAGCRQTMQVHDEIVMEVPDDLELEDVEERIREHMEHPFAEEPLPLKDGSFIPLIVDPGFGPNWGDAKV